MGIEGTGVEGIVVKVNLGCGTDFREGWINIDFNKNAKADLYLNVEEGLPFGKDSVDYVLCSHLLEHLQEPIKLLHEIERVLKPDGIAEIVLPHFNWLDHHRDLTHKHYCTSQTFCKFVQETSYQTRFEIIEMAFCCPYWKIVHFFGARFLEKIGYPIYQIVWKLKKHRAIE